MHSEQHKSAHHGTGQYALFGAMIATSTLLMYGLMYLNTFQLDHVFFSETRLYMDLIMGATMAVVMLTFMWRMYSNWKINAAIYVGSVVLFAVALWLVRSQQTVDDVSYMRAMIPHHSIAILTSKRAQISDPRVRKLADQIIASQQREIVEMKTLIGEIEAGGGQSTSSKNTNELVLGDRVPSPDAAAVEVPEGFRAEVVVSGLTYPTSVEFDDNGLMYIAEAGYSYGDSTAEPRILRVSSDGQVEAVVQGESLRGPVNDLLWHDDQMFLSHRGKISVLEDGGNIRDLVTGLPSDGDHHNNQMTVGPDGKIYFGQGTATNSGVVGVDNYKMGWLREHPSFHDIPPHEMKLTGRAHETPNALGGEPLSVNTSAFQPFATSAENGTVIQGQAKSNGTILRMNSDGSELEVYAWGLRNPFGVMWSPDDVLYATENGFDVRGSRPIANDEEDVYVIKEGAWYGWPDYAMGKPVTDPSFHAAGHDQPQFLMAEHPPLEQPWLNFPKHSSITKLDFSEAEAFGKGQMFVAFFGHMSPMTGEAPEEHGGHRVVRIDPDTKEFETFFGKKHGHSEHGQKQEHSKDKGEDQHNEESSSAGPRRLMDVRFSPDGQALYIADFGAMAVKDKPLPMRHTGVIWRVVPEATKLEYPPANLSLSHKGQ